MSKEQIQFNNNMALNSLRNSLQNEIKYGFTGCTFKGLVVYEAYSEIYKEVMEILLIIAGADPEVKLDVPNKANVIKADDFHMDFNPRFTTSIFTFNETLNTLVIVGNSSKMGNYKVSIQEVN